MVPAVQYGPPAQGARVPLAARVPKQLVEETTENAVGAMRRPHRSPTDARGPRPSAAQSAVARSASFDAGVAVDQP